MRYVILPSAFHFISTPLSVVLFCYLSKQLTAHNSLESLNQSDLKCSNVPAEWKWIRYLPPSLPIAYQRISSHPIPFHPLLSSHHITSLSLNKLSKGYMDTNNGCPVLVECRSHPYWCWRSLPYHFVSHLWLLPVHRRIRELLLRCISLYLSQSPFCSRMVFVFIFFIYLSALSLNFLRYIQREHAIRYSSTTTLEAAWWLYIDLQRYLKEDKQNDIHT